MNLVRGNNCKVKVIKTNEPKFYKIGKISTLERGGKDSWEIKQCFLNGKWRNFINYIFFKDFVL